MNAGPIYMLQMQHIEFSPAISDKGFDQGEEREHLKERGGK